MKFYTKILTNLTVLPNISKSITKLTLRYNNAKMNFDFNLIPSNINILDITCSPNDKIKIKLKHIPPSVNNLHLGVGYNQKLNDDYIPEHIKIITLFAHNPIINSLPNTIHTININHTSTPFIKSEYNCYPINNLPYNLQIITIQDKKFLSDIKIPFGCEIIIRN